MASSQEPNWPTLFVVLAVILIQALVAALSLWPLIGLNVGDGFDLEGLGRFGGMVVTGIPLYLVVMGLLRLVTKLPYKKAHTAASVIGAALGFLLGPFLLIPLGITLTLFWVLWPRVEARYIPVEATEFSAPNAAGKPIT